ncbi:unnamed protein product [Clonostachys rosea f. rosea IK726]|uniref:Uncharacterized protein n=1 Tax=Clonostachys rosea f. rosea IK726 TaxID=1349383 RepID=A0ACA9U9T6_BIOOC|nr:unnamed protein product [Clonostachys rosea f. rosea IK726]
MPAAGDKPELPDPGPFPEELLRPQGPPYRTDYDSALAFEIAEAEYSMREDCDRVGFTLYRAYFGPRTDERFPDAVRRLDAWVRHFVLSDRYRGLDADTREECRLLDSRLDPQRPLPSRELAKRFHLEVIEDYPGKEHIVAGHATEDGEEDFSSVGEAFTKWVTEHVVTQDDLYVRNDHCLIVDEKALEALERLPRSTPEPGPEPANAPQAKLLYGHNSGAWVWMLDQEYIHTFTHSGPEHIWIRDTFGGGPRYTDGLPASPWIRIMPSSIPEVWFHRPRGFTPSNWTAVIQRDKQKFDKISWWNPVPSAVNEVYSRKRREQLAWQQPEPKEEKGG